LRRADQRVARLLRGGRPRSRRPRLRTSPATADGGGQGPPGRARPPDQVAELTRILDEDGYMADFEAAPDGTFHIVEHHCAIFGVARRYGQACASEIAFLRDVLPDADVERVHHMVSGAHMCAYEITPRPRRRAKRG